MTGGEGGVSEVDGRDNGREGRVEGRKEKRGVRVLSVFTSIETSKRLKGLHGILDERYRYPSKFFGIRGSTDILDCS